MRFNIFKRNKDEETVAPELRQYYEAEKKERAGLSWLLAIVSVAFVSLVLIGLFFGGRWLYNRVTDSDAATETTQVNEEAQQPTTPDEPDEDVVEDQEQAAEPAPAQQPAATPAPAPAPTPGTTTGQVASQPTQTPTTGDSSLPSTGPKENLLAVFTASTLVFALAHNLYSRKV